MYRAGEWHSWGTRSHTFAHTSCCVRIVCPSDAFQRPDGMCQELTTCSGNDVEMQAPTPTSDRTCAAPTTTTTTATTTNTTTTAESIVGPCQKDITCEDCIVPAQLQCPVGHVLFIKSAIFGRTDNQVCPFQDPNSMALTTCRQDITAAVRNLCDGKAACSISTCNAVWGDPCVSTYKYVETDFLCATPNANAEASSVVCSA